MARFFKKRTENMGLPPGSLVFIGKQKVENPSVEYVAYDADKLTEFEFLEVENIPKTDKDKKQWYNVTGLHHVDFMKQIQSRIKIHGLVMEDVMNTGQRAKFEEFDDFIFITLKMLRFDEKSMKVLSEQISFVLRETTLLSFQEEVGDTFDAVRERLKREGSNIRKMPPNYLLYALLDSIVDNYVYLIEHLGEKIDDLELRVLENPNEEVLGLINTYKRELHFILKVVKPAKELMQNLLRSENTLVKNPEIAPFFRDLSGLVTHAIESVEAYRTILSDYIQVYHSTVSYKMNDIMKVLTIFSAIFIPLSFFAGVYGTNFENLPELHYQNSYYFFWGFMVLVASGMLYYFYRKGWF